ncbi:Uncharacterised protein (plasmid) [Klebsiella pneumoniae]|nr:Uncharacterised protein [Klebsiella pneumoniae]
MVSLQRIQEHLSYVVQHLFHIYDRKSRPRRIWPAARFSIAELQIKLDVSHHERVGVEHHASLPGKERLSLRLCDKARADTFSSAVRINGDTENKVMVVTRFYSNQAEHMLTMASQQNFASFDARPMIIRHRLGWVAQDRQPGSIRPLCDRMNRCQILISCCSRLDHQFCLAIAVAAPPKATAPIRWAIRVACGVRKRCRAL